MRIVRLLKLSLEPVSTKNFTYKILSPKIKKTLNGETLIKVFSVLNSRR